MSSANSRPAPVRTAHPVRIAALGAAIIAAGLGIAGCGASQPSADVAEQPRIAEDRRAWRDPATGGSAPEGGAADPYAAASAPRARPVDGPAAYEPSSARAPAWPSAHREVMPPESTPLPPIAETSPPPGRPSYAGSGSYAPPPPAPSHAAVPPGWTVTPPPPAPYGAMPPRPADGYAPAGGPVPAAATAAGSTVVVQHGETVYRIASRHGVSVQSLMQANNLTSPGIKGGQTLVIPPR